MQSLSTEKNQLPKGTESLECCTTISKGTESLLLSANSHPPPSRYTHSTFTFVSPPFYSFEVGLISEFHNLSHTPISLPTPQHHQYSHIHTLSLSHLRKNVSAQHQLRSVAGLRCQLDQISNGWLDGVVTRLDAQVKTEN